MYNRTELSKAASDREFLRRKWARELDYRLMKSCGAYRQPHPVRFEYEWRRAGQWYRTHGNEHWEFNIRPDAPARHGANDHRSRVERRYRN